MNIKRIILDVDNTICPSDEAFIKACEVLYPNLTIIGHEARKWNFVDCIPDLDPDLVMPTFASDEFFSFLEPYPYVVEEIAKIREKGIEVAIASQCSPQSVGKKAQWIEEHFPKIEQYPKIGWGKSKAYLSLGKGDLFIDDHPRVLDSVGSEYKWLFKGKEGQEWQDESDYSYLTTWKDFASLIDIFNSILIKRD